MLFSIYLSLTIFGALVTLADMLLLAGHGDHQGDADNGTSIGHDGHVDTHIDAHGDAGTDGFTDHQLVHGSEDGDSAEGHDANTEDHHSLAGLDKRSRINPLLKMLQIFRMLVYFSLGFGPVGLFAVLTHLPPTTSLVYSIPSGIAILAGAMGLRRLFSRELNSQIDDSSLLFSEANVIVPIFPGQMGKIRIKAGGSYIDRYAKCADPSLSFKTEEKVRVSDIDEDCLIIEPYE